MVRGIYKFSKIVEVVFLLHLYGILGCLLGGIVLGIFPTFYSISSVCRQYLLYGQVDVWSKFWEYYKESFWKNNLVGGVFYLWLALVFGLSVLHQQFSNILLLLLLFLTFVLWVISFIYFFPVNAHYDMLTLKEKIIKPFFYFFSNTFQSLLVLVSLGGIIWLEKTILPLLFLFGAAPFFFLEMAIMLPEFKRNDGRSQSHVKESKNK